MTPHACIVTLQDCYEGLKAANVATGGLDDVLDDLGKRFVKKASKNKGNTP